MSTPSRIHAGRAGSTDLRRIAAVLGTTLLAATTLQTGTAHGLAAPATPLAAAPAAQGAVSSLATTTPTAVGRLAPAGCTVTGQSDACDLYASAGTQTVAGQSIPVWGFSSSAAAAPATPGPNLVVREGDSVTLTVHNNLPAPQTLALSVPGLRASAWTAGLGQAGAAPGAAVTYTFTADHAGTFLYEAGHGDASSPGSVSGDDGARQAAMGLVGALVVLPADPAATAAYDDEQVLVVSELDPHLNRAADPRSFDLRQYRPAYRLVNGNSYPSIPSVATDTGHRVLLHYVNAGLRQHPLTDLDGTQTALARDGHALANPEPEVTAVLDPGTTQDELVTMPAPDPNNPSAPVATKVVLAESGTHLDNDGAADAASSSTQLAIGGMVVVLDTNAPVASGDRVGPLTSAVAVDQNPADTTTPVTVSATLSDATTGGSGLQAAELFTEPVTTAASLPDVGQGQSMTLPGGGSAACVAGTAPVSASVTGVLDQATLQALDGGKHIIYVRGEDCQGNWGVVATVTLNIQGRGPVTTGIYLGAPVTNLGAPLSLSATGDATASGSTVNGAKYWVQDGAPTAAQVAAATGTPGAGIPMAVNGIVNGVGTRRVAAETATIPVTGTSPFDPNIVDGGHSLYISSQDARGLWGLPVGYDFRIDRTAPTVTASTLQPTISNGLVAAPGHPGYAMVSAKVVDGGVLPSGISDAEAFLDATTGAPGTGLQMVPVVSGPPSTEASFYGLVPLSAIRSLKDGPHTVYVRAKDTAGNWGHFDNPASFTVDTTAPTLGALVAPGNAGASSVAVSAPYTDSSNSPLINRAEVWWGSVDPGQGNGTKVVVQVQNGTAIVSGGVPVTGLTPGSQRLNLRVTDWAGNWSNVSSGTVTITPVVLLQQTFAGTPAAPWTVFGTPFPTGVQALTASSPTSTSSLRTPTGVTAPTGSALSAATVTVALDTSALKQAGSATSPTTVVALTGTAGQVVTLQLQKTATGTAQVRGLLTRQGQAASPTAWTNLAGKGTVTLAWRAGPARPTATTAAGGVTVTVTPANAATTTRSTTGATTGLTVTGVSVGALATLPTIFLGTLTVASVQVTTP